MTQAEVENEVVVIDDEELVGERVRRTLRGSSWTTRYFSDPDVALGYLRVHIPGCVLVDERMPQLDGHDLIVELSRYPNLSATRVILCSNVEPNANILTIVSSLGARVVSKDVLADRETLLELVQPSLDSGDSTQLI